MRSLLPMLALMLFGGTAPLTNETIRVHRLELIDREGKQRAVMGTVDGKANFAILDGDGTLRIAIGIRPDDVPEITLYDAKGAKRATMMVQQNGDSGFGVFTAEKTGGAIFAANSADGSSLNFFDANNKDRVRIGFAESRGELSMFNAAASKTVSLATVAGSKAMATLMVRDPTGGYATVSAAPSDAFMDVNFGASSITSFVNGMGQEVTVKSAKGKAALGVTILGRPFAPVQ